MGWWVAARDCSETVLAVERSAVERTAAVLALAETPASSGNFAQAAAVLALEAGKGSSFQWVSRRSWILYWSEVRVPSLTSVSAARPALPTGQMTSCSLAAASFRPTTARPESRTRMGEASRKLS